MEQRVRKKYNPYLMLQLILWMFICNGAASKNTTDLQDMLQTISISHTYPHYFENGGWKIQYNGALLEVGWITKNTLYVRLYYGFTSC